MADSWNPQQYEKFKNERSQPFFDLADLLEEAKTPAIVDLGCGTGELTKILHEKTGAASTLGIDNSSNMLEKAKAFESAHLQFALGDLGEFYKPNSFDIIFSNAALQWCPGHRKIFENIRRSLKPGGQIAFQVPMNHDYPSHTVADEVSREKPFRDFLEKSEAGLKTVNLLNADQYSELLYDLGFKQQKVSLKVYTHILESREGVIDWVKGTMLTYYQSRLPKDVYEKFLSRYREELFKKLSDKKPFFYPFKRILIWGSLLELGT